MLIGFMGAGKSTLGRRLAAQSGGDFVDLDEVIEQRSGCSVAELFASEGESGFRARELAALRDLAARRPRPAVVAVGGGIVETPGAAPLLRELGTIVWLAADPHVCVARLGAARATRPLLAPGNAWQRRWEVRAPLYRALAAAVVSTHPEGIETSLEQLAGLAAGGPPA